MLRLAAPERRRGGRGPGAATRSGASARARVFPVSQRRGHVVPAAGRRPRAGPGRRVPHRREPDHEDLGYAAWCDPRRPRLLGYGGGAGAVVARVPLRVPQRQRLGARARGRGRRWVGSRAVLRLDRRMGRPQERHGDSAGDGTWTRRTPRPRPRRPGPLPLTSLDLSYCKLVSDAGAQAIGAGCSSLTSLNLGGCDQVLSAEVALSQKK